MHGCGNDFIVVDAADGPIALDAGTVRRLCDRRTGVGADGILVIGTSRGRRWPLAIHNADGTLAEACGNGSRCVARYLLDRHGVTAVELETAGGVVRAWRDPAGIALELAAPVLGEHLRIEHAGRDHEAWAVAVGNPNVVVFVDHPATVDLVGLARAVSARLGPANVAAAAARGPGEIDLRVHERGVGETLACGTGSCAAVAAARARRGVTSDTVRVTLPGGTLVVRPRGARYELAGPAEYVFTGQIGAA